MGGNKSTERHYYLGHQRTIKVWIYLLMAATNSSLEFLITTHVPVVFELENVAISKLTFKQFKGRGDQRLRGVPKKRGTTLAVWNLERKFFVDKAINSEFFENPSNTIKLRLFHICHRQQADSSFKSFPKEPKKEYTKSEEPHNCTGKEKVSMPQSKGTRYNILHLNKTWPTSSLLESQTGHNSRTWINQCLRFIWGNESVVSRLISSFISSNVMRLFELKYMK